MAGGQKPIRLKWGGCWETEKNMATIPPGMQPRPRRSTTYSREVIPEFYTRDNSGIPTRMGQAHARKHGAAHTLFLASRAVREYTEQHYLPAAVAYGERAANKGAVGREMIDWQDEVDQKWARCVSENCMLKPTPITTYLKLKSF